MTVIYFVNLYRSQLSELAYKLGQVSLFYWLQNNMILAYCRKSEMVNNYVGI